MENIGEKDSRREHNTQHSGSTQQTANGAPTGFEGMNFEQQRGSYKNSDGGGVPGKDSGRNNATRRKEP